MKIVNLNLLNHRQEIPKIAYRPFKTYGGCIYLEKIVSSKSQEWTEGIYELSLIENKMQRIDVGKQVKEPFLFDMEIPYVISDINKLSKHSKIYFSMTTETPKNTIVNFYEINLDTREQTPILTFSFARNSLEYLGMEMLTDGYFFFRLNENGEDEMMDFFDIVYLVDVKEKAFYRVHDPVIRMTFGDKIVFDSRDKTYMMVEESYLTESEQFEFLTSRDLELAIEVPKEFSENFVHKNAVYLIAFDTFLEEVKKEVRTVSYETLESIYMDGIIRIIGESKQHIYYRQRVYDFVLKQHNDFMSRMMIGNEVIIEFDKKTLDSKVVAKEPYPNNIFVNPEGIYKTVETDDSIEIFDLKTGKNVVSYEKKTDIYEEESFEEYIETYLMVRCSPEHGNAIECIKIIDTAADNEVLAIVRDYFILDDIVFTI